MEKKAIGGVIVCIACVMHAGYVIANTGNGVRYSASVPQIGQDVTVQSSVNPSTLPYEQRKKLLPRKWSGNGRMGADEYDPSIKRSSYRALDGTRLDVDGEHNLYDSNGVRYGKLENDGTIRELNYLERGRDEIFRVNYAERAFKAEERASRKSMEQVPKSSFDEENKEKEFNIKGRANIMPMPERVNIETYTVEPFPPVPRELTLTGERERAEKEFLSNTLFPEFDKDKKKEKELIETKKRALATASNWDWKKFESNLKRQIHLMECNLMLTRSAQNSTQKYSVKEKIERNNEIENNNEKIKALINECNSDARTIYTEIEGYEFSEEAFDLFRACFQEALMSSNVPHTLLETVKRYNRVVQSAQSEGAIYNVGGADAPFDDFASKALIPKTVLPNIPSNTHNAQSASIDTSRLEALQKECIQYLESIVARGKKEPDAEERIKGYLTALANEGYGLGLRIETMYPNKDEQNQCMRKVMARTKPNGDRIAELVQKVKKMGMLEKVKNNPCCTCYDPDPNITIPATGAGWAKCKKCGKLIGTVMVRNGNVSVMSKNPVAREKVERMIKEAKSTKGK